MQCFVIPYNPNCFCHLHFLKIELLHDDKAVIAFTRCNPHFSACLSSFEPIIRYVWYGLYSGSSQLQPQDFLNWSQL